MGIVLNYCQYGVPYLGSCYNTGPYIDFPHFGNSNLGKLPHASGMYQGNVDSELAELRRLLEEKDSMKAGTTGLLLRNLN